MPGAMGFCVVFVRYLVCESKLSTGGWSERPPLSTRPTKR